MNWTVVRSRHSSKARSVAAGDLAMPQAKLTGERRCRPATPSSTPKPAKHSRTLVRKNPTEEEASLVMPSQDRLGQIDSDKQSQDLLEPSSLAPSRRVDYEAWTLERYKHAITIESRRRFWTFASEAVKKKMSAELLLLSPSSNTRKQAHVQGWLVEEVRD